MKVLLILALLSTQAMAALPLPGTNGAPNDPRYCGEPVRDSSGRIKRNATTLVKFSREFPCPATLAPGVSCKGWQIDHVIPLASGGCDSQQNMQWLPMDIKTCALKTCKDRWERVYHATPRKIVSP